jgi:adenylosuccinate synthase
MRKICLRAAGVTKAGISLQIPRTVTDYFIITANKKNGSRVILEGACGWIFELNGGKYVNVLKGHTKKSKRK